MKQATIVLALLVTALLFVPELSAQDLSKYRNFSLGTSLSRLSKQIEQRPADANLVQESPALLQELLWRPSMESDAVQKVLFSFYNSTLYKIAATYNTSSTEGLTSGDMVGAISASYGVAKSTVASDSSQANLAYRGSDTPIAHWEDAQYSLTLSRGSFFNTFELVMYSKELNGQAEASIADAARTAEAGAPQRDIARLKKAAVDLETARQSNLKAFRP